MITRVKSRNMVVTAQEETLLSKKSCWKMLIYKTNHTESVNTFTGEALNRVLSVSWEVKRENMNALTDGWSFSSDCYGEGYGGETVHKEKGKGCG